MVDVNKLRTNTIKRICNTFLQILKDKYDITLKEYEAGYVFKELQAVIGYIELDNNKFKYEIKREISLSGFTSLNNYTIKYNGEDKTLPEFFDIYFLIILSKENEYVNKKLSKE